MRVDHVIWAAADLDAAALRVSDALGLDAVGGGVHEGLGTRNLIVPLGGGYLELLAVADFDDASRGMLGAGLISRLRDVGEGVWGWAVAVDDVAALGLPVTPIAREGMSARLAGVMDAAADPSLPFFIARDPGVPDPGGSGSGSGSGLAGGGGISWVEVAGDAALLRSWLGDAFDSLPLRVVEGSPRGVRAVGVGERELRS